MYNVETSQQNLNYNPLLSSVHMLSSKHVADNQTESAYLHIYKCQSKWWSLLVVKISLPFDGHEMINYIF